MVEAAGIEPEAADLPATSNPGQVEETTGQIWTVAGQTRTAPSPAHVEERTDPVTSGTSSGHETAPIAPPQGLLFLAWAWPQLRERMRAGIVAMVQESLRIP